MLFVFLVGSVVTFFIYQNKARLKDYNFTKAQVVSIDPGNKLSFNIKYEYFVQNKMYFGYHKIYKYDTGLIGNIYCLKYSVEKPDVSTLKLQCQILTNRIELKKYCQHCDN